MTGRLLLLGCCFDITLILSDLKDALIPLRNELTLSATLVTGRLASGRVFEAARPGLRDALVAEGSA